MATPIGFTCFRSSYWLWKGIYAAKPSHASTAYPFQGLVVISSSFCKCQMSTENTPSASSKKVTETGPGNASTGDGSSRSFRISRQMQAYLERAKDHDRFLEEKTAEYEIGRRHLANIMGANVDTFMQEDINNAIAYLLPSGLFAKKARPMMEHPSKLFPPQKAAQFDVDGRPFHHLFYTGKPNYYQIIHDIESKILELNSVEDAGGECTGQFSVEGLEWIDKEELEEKTLEKLGDDQYGVLQKCLYRLISHPFSRRESEFIGQYFKKRELVQTQTQPAVIEHDDVRGAFAVGQGQKKKVRAKVTVYRTGSGQYIINGENLNHVQTTFQDREELLFPLFFTRLIGQVDVEAEVSGGGHSGQAGAIRHGLSLALTAFLSDLDREKLRQAGLLQRDLRLKERKKPGQPGARKKPTWKKR